jgi:DNA polymerase I-like protein with 3'-5' exonuclease and polymerase domains
VSVAAGIKVIRNVREALYALQDDVDVACDLETNSLYPHSGKVAVVSLYGDMSSALAVLHVRGSIPAELKAFLEDPARRFSYHNGVSFDLPFLLHAGVDAVRPRLHDTMVIDAMLNSTGRHDHYVSLQAAVERRLGITLSKNSGGHGHWMDPELTDQQVQYCMEDISEIHALRRAQYQKAKETGQMGALELETAVHAPTALMTYRGLPISLDALGAYLEEQLVIERGLTAEVDARFGPTNYGSHVQIKRILRTLGVHLPSTDGDFLKEVVFNGWQGLLEGREYRDKEGKPFNPPLRFESAFEQLGSPIGLGEDILLMLAEDDRKRAEEAILVLDKITTLKRARKRRESYGPKFQEFHVHHGIVHARFNQTKTDTGRYSSSDPNLQQVPRDMRWVFGHRPGYKIVSVDYSQIEVVVAAYQAQDKVLLDIIESGRDIHTMVASAIFGVPYENIDKHDPRRRQSKAGSFTYLFGGGAQRFVDQARAEGADISLAEGKKFGLQFFDTFQGVARKRQQAYSLANSGRRVVEIRLPSGLKRHLVGANITGTRILNTSVQGTAAAGIKNALRLAHQRGLSRYIGAQVHDELVGWIEEQYAEEYAEELSRTMIEGMQAYVPVNIRTEKKVGDVWL